MSSDFIVVKGARQNNLKNLDLKLPLHEFIVVTGVSGSGKSSLAFDTIYAEGQRRYVETFSPYARQFLDRMDKPQVDAIEGIPPAIAIDQTNPVRTSRSTVGTMTELNDHIKLLFARAGQLFCQCCGAPVRRDTPDSIYAQLVERAAAVEAERAPLALITFPVPVPDNFTEEEILNLLTGQGYTRIHRRDGTLIEVIQDRVRLSEANRERIAEALEVALKHGRGRVNVYPLNEAREALAPWRYSSDLHCAECDIHYRDPSPNLFSFNSPVGACDTCRGFGRTMGIDYGLVIPDESKTLAGGAVKPWQTASNRECQTDLMRFARKRGVPTDMPWRDLSDAHKQWVLEGEGSWEDGLWYGVRRFFDWLETKSYKMHIRVLLSKYRAYNQCPACQGARLKPDALLWRIGTREDADNVLPPEKRFRPAHVTIPAARYAQLPGLTLHDVMLLPIERCHEFMQTLHLPAPLDEATDLLLGEIRTRLRYLVDVGLGYLTLDRQSRTLSGGEVQRINLTTALGTSLVNALFVLDEPSIGLHPRDMQRVVDVMHRLRNAGNTLLVVEHDPQVMLAADRILDMGPGPGERGGKVVFFGTPQELLNAKRSLTAQYLRGEKTVVAEPANANGGVATTRVNDTTEAANVSNAATKSRKPQENVPSPLEGPIRRGSEQRSERLRQGAAQAGLLARPGWSSLERIGTAAGRPAGRRAGMPGVKGQGEGVRGEEATLHLEILGATEHNLKNVDVRIPLGRFVCITGVSGSGKSTLVQDVCYPALRKLKGQPTEPPGQHRVIRGHEHIKEVVLVDQSPIGKTARSNPASYVGAFDAIRQIFAAEPAAKERGYTVGTFSFNAGQGRCPTCTGSGFEHVEMQFLSDVYIRCPDCDGKRYRPEVLEVKLLPWQGAPAKSISDVLDMTVSEAIAFFAEYPEVRQALEPLEAVGLDYLKLGQPVPTLSGGEAQRLKLAGFLAEACKEKKGRGRASTAKGHTLFLFDEPTTGLHFDDIARLLRAFRQLLDEGHSLVVIEHNLDVIRAADWLIDLGPEGGEAGGEVVCVGTPFDVMRHPTSHTGKALRDYETTLGELEGRVGIAHQITSAEGRPSETRGTSCDASVMKAPNGLPAVLHARDNAIRIHNAREHNLKNVDITIPRDKFTVITGVSGSGKSTVAFDILFGEGQRRYLESLNAYARQFVQPSARPDVDAIFGIPPTVAIEQRTSRGGRKSTVATMTEIYHFLRLLFVKLGTQYCPDCDIPIEPQTPEAILARILRDYRNQPISVLAPLVTARKGYYTDLAKWAAAKGYAHLRVDGQLLPTDQWPRLDRFKEHDIELPVGEVTVTAKAEADLRDLLHRALDFGKGVVKIAPAVNNPPSPGGRGRGGGGAKSTAVAKSSALSKGRKGEASETTFSTQRACPGCGRSFAELDPRLFSYNSKHGWCEHCYGTGLELHGFDEEQTGEEIWWNAWYEGTEHTCPACDGKRLRPEALAVRFQRRNIAEFAAMPVEQAERVFRTMKLSGRAAEIARDILTELRGRLRFLREVGLSYLSLDRAAPTLSGGEAQRIRLAAQLGSNLRGVCYILDEPTIGLHPRDNRMLLDTLHKLEAKGNTVVVVEHDEETIRSAEHVVDLGPGAGVNGGRVVAEGTLEDLLNSPDSLTGRFLANPVPHPLVARRPCDRKTPKIEIVGARLNNLRGLRVALPLERLVVVTGVSGSGKSTLVRQVLHENLHRLLSADKRRKQREPAFYACKSIKGWEGIKRVLEVDQTPIGKTPRSCPATYVGLWDHIRRLFAGTNEARLRGYTASRFSFNVSSGRCDACEGQGVKKIEMSFLPDVEVACEVCNGARFNQETLDVLWKGKTIAQVLAMSVDEAAEFFAAHAPIHHALKLLQDVGLGYLTLGQQSPTLSGGEAQRIKLVTELAKAKPKADPDTLPPGKAARANASNHTLYILDEPTIGLHMADVEKLIRVLHRLVDAGNTVVVIEHNLDVIAEADWLIDLGPEGGAGGGRVVAQGTPEEVAKVRKGSQTAKFLRAFMKERTT